MVQKPPSKSLEERILELEAREEIKNIIANYNHGVDKFGLVYLRLIIMA